MSGKRKHSGSVSVLGLLVMIASAIPLGMTFQPQAAAQTQASPSAAQRIQAYLLENQDVVIEGVRIHQAEIQSFYHKRSFTPAWNIGYNWGTGGREDPARLERFVDSFAAFSKEHGIVFSVEPRALFSKLSKGLSAESAVQTEILITHYLLDLAHALRGDRANLAQIYPGWSFENTDMSKETDLAAGLAQAAASDAISLFLSSLAPRHESYKNLTRVLSQYTALQEKGGWGFVEAGPTIHLGERSSRVQQVRGRLLAEGYKVDLEANDPALYEDDLHKVVVEYQIRNGLKPDGELGGKTIAAMNVSAAQRVTSIIANMERWRHMPAAFPDRYVVVNIPAYAVDVMEDHRSFYRDAVIVGRPERKTPFIQSEIRSVIFNPAWHVPSKIARKDILPKLRKDPHYLEKMGFVINGSAQDPYGAAVDWRKIQESEFHFRLRQAPGELNSLGRLKFDFDNNFSVYLHGTPHAELFEKAERPLSSGCVRIQDPEKFAEIVLRDNLGDWNVVKIQTTIAAEKTRWMKVMRPLPLYIVYWTVLNGNDDGPAHFRQDIYGYDRLIVEEVHKNQWDKARERLGAGGAWL